MSVMGLVLLGLLSAGTTSSSGAMNVTDNGLLAAANVGRSIAAVNLADAGVQDTILWLSSQSAPPPNTAAFAPSSTSFALPLWSATTQTGSPPRAVVQYPDSSHTFSITIYPNSANAGNVQKGYLIESIGNSAGFKQVLHVYVSQTSFGHYDWFEGNGGPGTWNSNIVNFDGPTHYNTMYGSYYLNWRDGTPPIFTYTGPDAFTTGFTFGWKHNGSVVSGPPADSDTAGWAALSVAGPTSIRQNQNQVTMPTSATDKAKQKLAALGTLSSSPSGAVGATLCPSGGIYIHGAIQQMTLSVSPTNSGTQIIELYQTDPNTSAQIYQKITLDATTNQTSIQTGTYTSSGAITLDPSSSWPAPMTGLTNGVVYCDGSIGSTGYPEGGIKGVIADNAFSGTTRTHTGALTIATDPTANIVIDGNLLLNTPRQIQQNSGGQYQFHNKNGSIVTSATTTPPTSTVPIYVPESSDTGQFLTKAGTLGFVTNNIIYAAANYNATGQTGTAYQNALEIDAAQFEYGSNGESAYASYAGGLALCSMGSNVHVAGTFGWSGTYYVDSKYDPRLSDAPPPVYPTTVNRYTLVSWQRVNTTVEGTP